MANETQNQNQHQRQEQKQEQKHEHVIFAYRTSRHQSILSRKFEKTEIPSEDDFITFESGFYETEDPKMIALLRAHPANEKNSKERDPNRTFREMSAFDAEVFRKKIMTSRLPKRWWIKQLAVINGEISGLTDD